MEEQRGNWRWTLFAGLLLVLGLFHLVAGIAIHFSLPSVIASNIRQASRLVEGTRLWSKWLQPEYKVQMKAWPLSVKNPDAILDGAVPEVQMTGPFTFDVVQNKKVVRAEKGTVTYNRSRTYHFNPQDSCPSCKLDNRITIPNMVYQRFLETAAQPMFASALLKQKFFLDVEVDEFLFTGYKDPYLEEIKSDLLSSIFFDGIYGGIPERIGLFFDKNGTNDGQFEIDDGVHDPEHIGRIVAFNGEKEVPLEWGWTTRQARSVNGSDDLFGPFIEKNERIEIFVRQLCRSIYLVFDREVIVRGVPAYRFVLPPEVLDPLRDENKGFCNPTPKVFFDVQEETGCFPKGLIEISKCVEGEPPVTISLPNFLFADEEVRKSVKGLAEPDKERDLIFLDVEPRLGVVLAASRRSQINVELWKEPNVSLPLLHVDKLRNGLIPVLIMHEDVEIDDETLDIVNSELISMESLGYSSSKALVAVGVVMILISLLLFFFKTRLRSRCFGEGQQKVAPAPDKPTQPSSAEV